MSFETIDQRHTNNIADLVEKFGQDKEDEITSLYQQQREIFEEGTVKEFVPIVTLTATREILIERYGKGNKKDKSYEIERT